MQMIQKVKTLMLSLMLTAATLTAGAQQNYENRGFKALLNGKLPIEVMFQTTQNADNEWVTEATCTIRRPRTPLPS